MNTTRPSWDTYFLEIARVVSTRSTCKRLNVGCVLVTDRHILTTGYNGSVQGQPHCIDEGCDCEASGGCKRTVHAEINAISQAAMHAVSTKGATAYLTHSPCEACFKALVNAGIRRVVFARSYRIPLSQEFAERCGVELLHLESQTEPAERETQGLTRPEVPTFVSSDGFLLLPLRIRQILGVCDGGSVSFVDKSQGVVEVMSDEVFLRKAGIEE